jgi:malate synthase
VWQWVHNQTPLDTGEPVTADLVRSIAAQQLAEIAGEIGETAYAASRFELARRVFEQVALDDDFADFLTLPAYAAAVDGNH